MDAFEDEKIDPATVKIEMKKYSPFFLLALPYLFLKISNLGIWLSDTNIYFYTGNMLLEGKILYKDIFFTNFPLFPYISALYVLLTHGNLPIYYFTAPLEVTLTAFLLYVIVLKEKKSRLIALSSSAIFLYSFIILVTSDHQSGVFLGGLFSVLAYFFYTKKKLFFTGATVAAAILTKAYFLPIALSFFLYLCIIKKRLPLTFLLGGIITTSLILLPSVIFASTDFFKDVFTYSLARSQGIPKENIARFFLTHDALFAFLLFWNILTLRKQLFFGLVSLLSLIFFLLYQDIYYLYLNICIPFLALSFPGLYETIQRTFSFQRMVLPTIIGVFICYNSVLYITSYRNLQKISDIDRLVEIIRKEHPRALYGINSLTPALAYLSDTPLLNGIVDTNENIYRKGFLDKELLTDDAITAEAIIVSSAAIYPESSIRYPLLGGIFDEKKIADSCTSLGVSFFKPEGVENAVHLLRCRKSRSHK